MPNSRGLFLQWCRCTTLWTHRSSGLDKRRYRLAASTSTDTSEFAEFADTPIWSQSMYKNIQGPLEKKEMLPKLSRTQTSLSPRAASPTVSFAAFPFVDSVSPRSVVPDREVVLLLRPENQQFSWSRRQLYILCIIDRLPFRLSFSDIDSSEFHPFFVVVIRDHCRYWFTLVSDSVCFKLEVLLFYPCPSGFFDSNVTFWI